MTSRSPPREARRSALSDSRVEDALRLRVIGIAFHDADRTKEALVDIHALVPVEPELGKHGGAEVLGSSPPASAARYPSQICRRLAPTTYSGRQMSHTLARAVRSRCAKRSYVKYASPSGTPRGI